MGGVRCPSGYTSFHRSSASFSQSFLSVSSDASMVSMVSSSGFFSSDSSSSIRFLIAFRTNSLHLTSECLRIFL